MLDILKGILGVDKRRARKLLVELITADDGGNGPTTARERRCAAAKGLIEILRNERGGEQIVARRFVKIASRQDQGTRALLKLSDDELDQFGYGSISPVSNPIAFEELICVVMKYAGKSSFFKTTISAALKEVEDGVAAILYLAMVEANTFFHNVDHQLVLNFCRQVVTKERSLCPKWYCGVKLLCILFMRKICPEGNGVLPLARRILPSILKELIPNATTTLTHNGTERSQKASMTVPPPLLPLIAACCEEIQSRGYWSAIPPSDTLNPFIAILINLLHPEMTGLRCLTTERGLALWTLMSLLKRRSILSFIPNDNLCAIGDILVDMMLHPWDLAIQGDLFEKEILRPLKSNLDLWCIESLCDLPRSNFNNALGSALDKGTAQLNSPNTTNPYEPLGLVERLLWMSNIKPPADQLEQIHRAMVKGDACGFLAQVLSHTGVFAPQDRGLWRAKGLAMTCLGNIVECMNPKQLRDCITRQMIDNMVAIKEHKDVPLVQKGQAIFTLQRYTLAADRCNIQPHHREDTSNMIEESWSSDSDDDL